MIYSNKIDFKVTSFKLDNGLIVHLSENHNSPTIATSLYYDVGSRDEVEGKTGFAHLFEHMMFEGSKNVDKGEHFSYVNKVGGSLNAFTTREYTAYFESIPSNQLELVLWLEADRMKSLLVNVENFNNQLKVVKEEMKSSYINRPYGQLSLVLGEISHKSYNYKHSTIGLIEDLNSSNVQYAEKFFNKYYNPNNAILTIVGDFKTEEAKKLVEKYFGKVVNKAPKKSELKLVDSEEEYDSEDTINDKLAKLPAIAFSFPAPNYATDEFYSALMLESILFNDESSRLYQHLIKDKEIAVSIYGGISDYSTDNLFYIYSITKKSKENDVIDDILAELENIKANGITEEELKKAKTIIKTEFTFKLQSNLEKALLIGKDALLLKNPQEINQFLDKIDAVTSDSVKNYLNKYMNEKNRKLVVVEVKGSKRIKKSKKKSQPKGIKKIEKK